MKIKEIDGYIKFDNGWELSDIHEQDCCERVYADFNYAKQYNMLGLWKDKTIFDIEWNEKHFSLKENIQVIEGLGFMIRYEYGGIFIPCYDEQNGYYNSGLKLELAFSDKKGDCEILDITNATKYIES